MCLGRFDRFLWLLAQSWQKCGQALKNKKKMNFTMVEREKESRFWLIASFLPLYLSSLCYCDSMFLLFLLYQSKLWKVFFLLFLLIRSSFASNCTRILYRVLCRHLGKWGGNHLLQTLLIVFTVETCSCWYKWWNQCIRYGCIADG